MDHSAHPGPDPARRRFLITLAGLPVILAASASAVAGRAHPQPVIRPLGQGRYLVAGWVLSEADLQGLGLA